MRTLTALLVALLLAGCGSTGENTATDASEGGDQPGLGFEGTTLTGAAFDGTSLAGRPAVLWFWAPWCPTCRSQIPNLTTLADRHGEQVSFVGVGGLSDKAAIVEAAGGIEHLTHLIDPEGTVWRHFGVTEQSTYTVLDAEGGIVSEGHLSDDELNALVARLAEG